jgi:hypothetical protein
MRSKGDASRTADGLDNETTGMTDGIGGFSKPLLFTLLLL